jgi:hypothetical protein
MLSHFRATSCVGSCRGSERGLTEIGQRGFVEVEAGQTAL